MAVQGRTDFTNYPFWIGGASAVLLTRDNETILQNGARATVLKKYTVMAQVAATKKWVPLTDVAAVDGSNTARGVYVGGDIAAAALVAGDVVGPIAVGGLTMFDASLVVLENSLTLDSVCSDDPAGADNGVVNVRRIEDDLARIGLYAEQTIDINKLEN